MITFRHGALLMALALAGCHAEDTVAVLGDESPQRSISVPLGTSVRVKLQNVGPGEYRSPPQISSSSLRFDEVGLVSPVVPAGLMQEFRFTAIAKGQAIVTFTHTDRNPTVVDTVTVR